MEERKVCKACDVEKPVTDYHKNPKMRTGRANVCKKCVALGKRIRKENVSSIEAQLKWDRIKEEKTRLSFVSKKDYLLMYEFLRGIGYDTDGDIHQQFLDKWNPHVKGKLMKKKKRRSTSLNAYLPNGEVNPNKKTNKKNPTD